MAHDNNVLTVIARTLTKIPCSTGKGCYCYVACVQMCLGYWPSPGTKRKLTMKMTRYTVNEIDKVHV